MIVYHKTVALLDACTIFAQRYVWAFLQFTPIQYNTKLIRTDPKRNNK